MALASVESASERPGMDEIRETGRVGIPATRDYLLRIRSTERSLNPTSAD